MSDSNTTGINKPKWAFGQYKLRNGKLANVTVATQAYLEGHIQGDKFLHKWNIMDGHHFEEPTLDLVELVRSDKYDKYAK